MNTCETCIYRFQPRTKFPCSECGKRCENWADKKPAKFDSTFEDYVEVVEELESDRLKKGIQELIEDIQLSHYSEEFINAITLRLKRLIEE